MLEYILAFVALLAVVGIMGWVVSAAYMSSARTERLVKSDYP